MKKYLYFLLSFFSFFFFVLSVRAELKIFLNTEFNYYLSPVQFTKLSQSVTNLNPKLVYSSYTNAQSSYVLLDVEALISSEFTDSHLLVSELFYSYGLSSKKSVSSSFVFGRKKVNWSLLEKDWNLGLFGSYFNANPLRPKEQGLLGVFYKYHSSNFLLNFVISPFFIPNQSGSVDIKEGKIYAYNRWNSFLYYDTVLDKTVLYTLEDINVYQFIQQWNFGFLLRRKLSNFYLTASYFYKPYAEPYIYANITDNIESEEGENLQVVVKVKPVMHHILLFEVELKQKNFSEYFSVVSDRPKVFNLLDNDKYSALVNKNILSAGVKYNSLLIDINLGVLYTQYNIVKQSVLSIEPDFRGIDDTYAYPYKTAIFSQIKRSNLLFSEDSLFFKYTYLFTSQVDIFSFKYTKQIRKHNLFLGFDILGHPFSGQVQGVFASNVANDFIYLGWGYAL